MKEAKRAVCVDLDGVSSLLGEHEVYIRKTLRLQLDDDDIGQERLIDFYEYIVTGLEPEEEFDAVMAMYGWASVLSARFKHASAVATIERRKWAGQVGVDLKRSGAKVTDTDVKHAIRTEDEWERLSREEERYEMWADIFRSFAILLYRKSDALVAKLGPKRKKKIKRRPA